MNNIPLSEDEIFLSKLSQFIYDGIRNRRWLYWPPGPMSSQVFDLKQCKEDLRRWLVTEDK